MGTGGRGPVIARRRWTALQTGSGSARRRSTCAKGSGMAVLSPYRVVLSDSDRRVFTVRARAERVAHRDVLRARIVLAAAEGQTNAAIARQLGICADTVRKRRPRVLRRGPGRAGRSGAAGPAADRLGHRRG